jgi:hypothetical protein
MSKENENVELKGNYPNDDLLVEQNDKEMDQKILASDKETGIMIWEDEGPDGNIIFTSIGNVTVSLPEGAFYSLTKTTQAAAKKLLSIE